MIVGCYGRAKIHADLTKAFKDVRIAANVKADADVTFCTGSPEKILLQRKHPAQRPRIDLGKRFKAVAARALAVKLRFRASGDCSRFDLYIILNVAILQVLVDVLHLYVYVFRTEKRKKMCVSGKLKRRIKMENKNGKRKRLK